ncbi:putative PIN family toxin of toxin-antitoxin system [Nitrospirillum amazonense]|uniref:Putative PIN family toxin of toxin-antitoxin system n=1 Tax=Nitrospirillum amazonense TaxID=28077 RepID=A0A560EXF4_9PROT|nr:putative toxin-antitoxin system toxin component, PIN family [Nitrospirillum amazonense]TWB14044.1 putative PIN family toxin of toxin-antitoxin system [Nitrospirillum amazonense]
MKRAALDTNILTAGLRSRRGASFVILTLLAQGRFRALVTTALFLEYEAVLKRPEQREAHGLNIDEIDGLLQELAALLEPVDVHFTWRPQLADPADELVLEAAVNGQADALVTHNIRDFGPAARFGVPVLRPAEFLQGAIK